MNYEKGKKDGQWPFEIRSTQSAVFVVLSIIPNDDYRHVILELRLEQKACLLVCTVYHESYK
jgi:hypothetical protein